MIPKNWVSRELGDIAEFVNGRGFKPHEWSNSGLPIIRIQNLNGSSEFNHFSGTYDPKIEVNSGDLLFAWSGSRGTSFGPHFWLGSKAVLNYHTWKVVPISKEIDKRFLYDALRLLTARIEDEAHGAAALVHTQKNRIVTYSIWLPPISEQRQIAAVLSTWDRAIELTEKLIAAKQKQKAALMQQLLTGKVRLPKFGKIVWRKCQLGDVASNSARRNGTAKSPVVYSVTNSVGMVPMDVDVIGESIDRYKAVAKHDFAYNPMRINVGSIAMWDGDVDVLFSPDYVVFQCGDELDAEFLNHFRKTHFWHQFVNRSGGGSVRVRIYFSDLAEMPLKLPPLDEQKAIAAVLNTQDREIELLQQKLDALRRQKKGKVDPICKTKKRSPSTPFFPA